MIRAPRPFTLAEMRKFYIGPNGKLYTVTDGVDMSKFVPGRTHAAAASGPVRR